MAYPPQEGYGGYPGPGAPQQNVTPWQQGQGGPHQWDDLPPKPLDDNPNAQPLQYQAPSMDGFQYPQGYENTGGFGQFSPMAPPPPPPPPSGSAPPMEFDSIGQLSQEDSREAMLNFVGKHCCYGKKAAEQMEITQIMPSTALHYTLETFGEYRSTGYAHEPFRGGFIDGPENGMSPAPWDIPCEADSHFQEHEKALEVPHSSVIKPCDRCYARGFLRCHRCQGLGWLRCSSCGGDGRVTRTNPEGGQCVEPCTTCGGDGRKHCYTCGGDGAITCDQCRGFRNLRCFIKLTVKFSNHCDDYIMEKTDMPDELVRDVDGVVIFEQVLPQVWPIVAYHVQEINNNSQRLVDHHYRSFTNERKLNQRQRLRAVPVTEVHYKWNDDSKRYWVYGREREVHAPDYPQQCCWGCNIL